MSRIALFVLAALFLTLSAFLTHADGPTSRAANVARLIVNGLGALCLIGAMS